MELIKGATIDPNSPEEREIRKQLGAELGVEFCSEQELTDESLKAAAEPAVELPKIVQVTVNDILQKLLREYEDLQRIKPLSRKRRRLASTLQLAANAVHQLALNIDAANKCIDELRETMTQLTTKRIDELEKP